MRLTVDIGNSAIKFGLFEDETLTSKFSIPTNRDATAGDLKAEIDGRLDVHIDRAIVCSVVPEVETAVRDFLTDAAWVEPVFVRNAFDFGLKINYQPLDSLGTDRLVNAFAAVEKYGAPVIVCSLGTATTIDAVSADREFLGGIIAPGMDAMAEALHLKASRLPNVEVERPDRLLGNSTVESIRSGVYYGYVSMVDGLIARIKAEVGNSKVVATGGNAQIAAAESDSIAFVDPDLIMSGLRALVVRQ